MLNIFPNDGMLTLNNLKLGKYSYKYDVLAQEYKGKDQIQIPRNIPLA